ncbi:MAG TPA: PfkB family carbohydrate kinase [Actinomycetota bacterium]
MAAGYAGTSMGWHTASVRVAVVGHVEWVEFARVDRFPGPGDIVHSLDWWEEPAGSGAVGAVQLHKLAGDCTFLTVLGKDATGKRAHLKLEALGPSVEAARRSAPTRRAVTLIDPNGERTITTLGERLAPRADDPLPWDELAGADAVYLTAGDPGAVRAARRARVLVATSRVLELLARAEVQLDAVVGSGRDPAERYDPSTLSPAPDLVVRTDGARGGSYETADGRSGTYDPAPLPGPLIDTAGGGDSFAGGLTFALGAGYDVEEALALAARCGAWCVAGRGPYEGQLTAADIRR